MANVFLRHQKTCSYGEEPPLCLLSGPLAATRFGGQGLPLHWLSPETRTPQYMSLHGSRAAYFATRSATAAATDPVVPQHELSEDSAEGGYLGAALHTGLEALRERQTQGLILRTERQRDVHTGPWPRFSGAQAGGLGAKTVLGS